MSSTALKITAAVLVALAVVLAIAGYRMSRQYASDAEQARQRGTAVPETMAVVASKPLAAFKPIDKESLALVPVSIAPPDGFARIEDVTGKQPLVDVDVGTPLSQRYFKESNALARVIPPGHQAISIEVNDVISVGGFVRPNDVVDVLVYLRGGSGVGETQARVLMRRLRVLAYEERIIDRPKGLAEDEDQAERRRQRTVVLAVPEAEVTRLMLGISLGDIRLAMHGHGPVVADLTPAEALALKDETKVPDNAVTAAQLGQVRPPPVEARRLEEQQPQKQKVEVYRGSEVEDVYR